MMLASRSYGDLSGPVVLFLHGFMGCGEDWRSICKELQPRHGCLTIDLPGHGDSAIWDGNCWDIESTAAACIDVLDSHSIEKCVLTGYSMGGRVALYLAIKFPDRFAGIVLESASPGLENAKERSARRRVDYDRAAMLEKTGLQGFLKSWYNMPLFSETLTETQKAHLLQKRSKNNVSAVARSLRELGTGVQPSLWNQLAEIILPLFLFVGEKDAKFIQIAEEMQQLNPGASINVFPNCGHNCHLENTKLFVTTLQTVLNKVF
ncbi:MAG: 2-succinyl-6-hydroxy-2,4-cyclohexadiene-1-carboxylate synthase [Calditrichia bacterium]